MFQNPLKVPQNWWKILKFHKLFENFGFCRRRSESFLSGSLSRGECLDCTPELGSYSRDFAAALLAIGFWASRTALAEQWTLEREFTPAMSADERDSLYADWQRAVSRAQDWIQ